MLKLLFVLICLRAFFKKGIKLGMILFGILALSAVCVVSVFALGMDLLSFFISWI